MRIIVLPAREEHWDGTGGAIATWVANVQAPSADTRVIGMTPSNEREWYSSPERLQRAGRWIPRVAQALHTITRIPRKRWEKALWLRDLLYVLLLFPEIRTSDVLYVHNRPQHAKFARWLGYRGKIVVHMHNDAAPYFRRISPRRVGQMDRFVFCSDFIRQRAVAQCGIPASRTEVVLNGVDADFTPSPVPMSPDLLFVGRLYEDKGPDTAIDAVGLLRERGTPATLSLVGGTGLGLHTSDTPYLAALKRRAEEINTRCGEEAIRFLGPRPLAEVLELMAATPIFIFPSRFEEPFGMVLAEAISRGAYPLAPPRGGIPEVLEVAGLTPLPDPVTAETFADALTEAQRSSTVQGRTEAAERVLSRLSWERIRADYQAQVIDPLADLSE